MTAEAVASKRSEELSMKVSVIGNSPFQLSFGPAVIAASNVLETGFSNLNILIHPSIALLNVGWFDRSVEKAQSINFYGPAVLQTRLS